MTVSRVLNGEAYVHEQTRSKVQEAIRELGYVPNPAARSLAAGRQSRIVLLYSNPSASYLSELLVGCMDQAGNQHVSIAVEQFSQGDTLADLLSRISDLRADAVILPEPLACDQELVGALVGAGVRVALISPEAGDRGVHVVSIDDASASRAIMEYLIGQGHRRIGFICGNPNQFASSLRLDGYRQVMQEHGLPIDEQLILPGDFTYRSGLAASEALFDLERPPTAIFASNDDMAAAAVATAHRRNLAVPGDVSICGFDDTAIATVIWPELTTIRQPIAKMAQSAVTLLLEAIGAEAGSDAKHLQLDFELIVRGSTGPAPSPMR